MSTHRRENGINDVALVRIEQFYPYPGRLLASLLARYESVSDVVWVQEEPRNMGAWSFLAERLRGSLGKGQTLRYVGRPRSASTATGSYKRHVTEQAAVLSVALIVGDESRRRPLATRDPS